MKHALTIAAALAFSPLPALSLPNILTLGPEVGSFSGTYARAPYLDMWSGSGHTKYWVRETRRQGDMASAVAMSSSGDFLWIESIKADCANDRMKSNTVYQLLKNDPDFVRAPDNQPLAYNFITIGGISYDRWRSWSPSGNRWEEYNPGTNGAAKITALCKRG